MKNFWSTFFASLLAFITGTIIFSCLSIFLFFGFVAFTITAAKTVEHVRPHSVLLIEASAIVDTETNDPFSVLFSEVSRNKAVSIHTLKRALLNAKNDANIDGVFLHLPAPQVGMALATELRNALEDFKESKKWIVSYGDMYSQGGYYISSVANEVYLNPMGTIGMDGLASQSFFYRNTLKKFGVQMEIFKVGTYKGAVEPFLLDSFSTANRQQMESYMYGIWNVMAKKVASSRAMQIDSLNARVDEGPSMFAPELYEKYHFVDGLLYERKVTHLIAQKVGVASFKDVNLVSAQHLAKTEEKAQIGSNIAVYTAEGVINGSYEAEPGAISMSMVQDIIDLADNDEIKAIVLRVNSPGGSAYTSDQIWDAVCYAKSKKPVVVSMSDYAASGGYYISCAANYIVAEPVTLTGSIGIYGMFPNLAGLGEMLDLRSDEVKTHKNADLYTNLFRPLTSTEKELMQKNIERGYHIFLSRVAEGRHMTLAQVDSIAQGRVWTGEQALERGLVDALGDVNTAIKKAAELANVRDIKVSYHSTEVDYYKSLFRPFALRMSEALMSNYVNEDELQLLRKLREVEQMSGIQAYCPFALSL